MIAVHTLRRLLLVALLASPTGSVFSETFEAVTFAVEPGKVYVPLAQVAARLRWNVDLTPDGTETRLKGTPISIRLVNNSPWVPLETLANLGASISSNTDRARYRIQSGRYRFITQISPKRIEVDLARQRLNAWQGSLLVLDTHISSGRYGNTPAGNFTAGPYKSRMHYSSKYNNAPMPWSVQITGHIFFHGYSSVPAYPASHGCIHVPLTGANPARFLYEWVDVGTPIRISHGQKEEIRRALPPA